MMSHSILAGLRHTYHRRICSEILGKRPGSEALSVADVSSRTSVDLASRMATLMGHPLAVSPVTGQTAGKLFSELTRDFIEDAFSHLGQVRPGPWLFSVSQAEPGIAAFDQYEHLSQLQEVLSTHKELTSALGADYLITPDIVIGRRPLDDQEINATEQVVDVAEPFARWSPLRRVNQAGRPILHASISCKWSMRSDRAQNTRTEALNLIRNRKGHTPHIVAVTLEPMPTRLASIALGTGDIDCTYHAALLELVRAVEESGNQDQAEVLDTLIRGRRLRDISDLPLDLAV